VALVALMSNDNPSNEPPFLVRYYKVTISLNVYVVKVKLVERVAVCRPEVTSLSGAKGFSSMALILSINMQMSSSDLIIM